MAELTIAEEKLKEARIAEARDLALFKKVITITSESKRTGHAHILKHDNLTIKTEHRHSGFTAEISQDGKTVYKGNGLEIESHNPTAITVMAYIPGPWLETVDQLYKAAEKRQEMKKAERTADLARSLRNSFDLGPGNAPGLTEAELRLHREREEEALKREIHKKALLIVDQLGGWFSNGSVRHGHFKISISGRTFRSVAIKYGADQVYTSLSSDPSLRYVVIGVYKPGNWLNTLDALYKRAQEKEELAAKAERERRSERERESFGLR